MSRNSVPDRARHVAGSSDPDEGAVDLDRSTDRFKAICRWSLIVLTVAAVGAFYHRPIDRGVRRFIANTYANTACQRLEEGKHSAALDAVQNALDWLPGDAALVYLRAQIYASDENWTESLADYSRVTDNLAPNFAEAYARRAEVHRVSANFGAAVEDLDRAIELSPEVDPGLLNDRAYVRALAGTDLETAHEEIELAIKLFTEQNRRHGQQRHLQAAFLDTRGYILFRLGQHKEALEDVERALRTLAVERDRVFKVFTDRKQPPGDAMRAFDKIQAEILYHRGEIHVALNQNKQADEDFALARDLGYSPPQSAR